MTGSSVRDDAGSSIDEQTTTIFCAPVVRDPRCPDCGRDGRYRDTVIRPLANLPVGGFPLVRKVAVPRYRFDSVDCGRRGGVPGTCCAG